MTDLDPAAGGRGRRLADGNEIPLLGLGVWQVPDGPECEDAVRWALEVGYRHIDTAQAYHNEKSVGRALRDSGVPREEVFITTKFSPDGEDPAAEAKLSLKRLGVERVDLYIVHSPRGGPTWAWPGMERALERGYTRSIGVSNFSRENLETLEQVAEVPPVLNQVQFSPFHFRRGLLAACEERDIVLEAYSPLGTGGHLDHPGIGSLAARLGRSPAQVLLRWGVERQIPVVAKSVHRDRIAENFEALDFTLREEDMAELDALDETGGSEESREDRWW